MPQDPVFFVVALIVILLSLAIHEFAHAKMADLAGDPTPRIYGRVTLNPLNHLDPVGTIMIILTTFSGFGIGWGKPVPMDPRKMRNPRWDHFAAVAAGPLSNLLQAAAYALILRVMLMSRTVGAQDLYSAIGPGGASAVLSFLLLGVMVNIGLCLFNLIPLGPLDGHWLLGTFLSEPARLKWYLWNRQVGGFVFLGLVLIGQLVPSLDLVGKILGPLHALVFKFFLGI